MDLLHSTGDSIWKIYFFVMAFASMKIFCRTCSVINLGQIDPNSQANTFGGLAFLPNIEWHQQSDQQKPGWSKRAMFPKYTGYSERPTGIVKPFLLRVIGKCKEVLTAPARNRF
jgi:hypothetical protein